MPAVTLERPVQIKPSLRRQIAPGPANNPSATRHGAMWITLAQNTASRFAGPLPSCISGHHAGSDRSIRSGGRMFDKLACTRHAAMLLRCCSLRSLGHQVMSGMCRAKSTTCWPVPLPASTTSPDLPSRWQQHGPDRLMVAMKRRCVQPAVGLAGGHPCRIPPHIQPSQAFTPGHAIHLLEQAVASAGRDSRQRVQRLRRAPGRNRTVRAQPGQMLRQFQSAQPHDASKFSHRRFAGRPRQAASRASSNRPNLAALPCRACFARLLRRLSCLDFPVGFPHAEEAGSTGSRHGIARRL